MSNKHKKTTKTKLYTVEQEIQYVLDKAEKLYSNNEIDLAINELKKYEEKYPNNADISYQIGAYTLKKSIPDSIKKLEKTLERFPDNLKTLLKLGDIHLKPGNIDRAEKYFHKAMELYPESPASYIGIGSLQQRKGFLPNAVKNYRKAIELQLQYPIKKKEPTTKKDFRVTEAENLLWDTLRLMAANGVHMFTTHGTLLGLVRNGALFTHDKDIDTTVPFIEIDRAIRILEKNGWVEVNKSFGHISPRAMLNLKTQISMDIAGVFIDKDTKKFVTGTWMPSIPKNWNILRDFNEINLIKKLSPDNKNKVWFLENPEGWLDLIYGNWRVPDENFDTMICGKNTRHYSPLLQCFTYARIFQNWVDNNIPRTLSLINAALEFNPNDDLLKKVLNQLKKRK